MKYESFDGRWDGEELSKFLLRDEKDIRIRFITESDYKIRVYYDEIPTYEYNSSNFLSAPLYPSNYQPMQQMQQNQQNQQSSATQYGEGGRDRSGSSPFSASIGEYLGIVDHDI